MFSWAPVKNFLWCYYRQLITSIALEKCKKECNIVKIILVQGKLKLLNFLMDFVLSCFLWFLCPLALIQENARSFSGRGENNCS